VRTADPPSFLQAMLRERVVAEDWLVSIDANRYSVPRTLIGKSVHQARDRCLQSIAQAALSAVKRPTDLLARYSGEERVALLPNSSDGFSNNPAQRACSA
jgi:GGDEF domain-containing protein